MPALKRSQSEISTSEQGRARIAKAVEEREERLNDLPSVAKRLAVSKFTVDRMIKAGHLCATRIGKRLLIAESEVQRVMREGCGSLKNGQ